jgi:hypothetical protein
MLKDILSISGQPGLYKLVSQAKNGIIVENLETKKRQPAYATAKISALEDIAIYTDEEEVPLFDVFKNINEKVGTEPAISHKASSNELKQFMDDILPDYDKDKVYVSDMKKLFLWYNILHKLEMLDFTEKEEEATEKEEKVEEAEVKE